MKKNGLVFSIFILTLVATGCTKKSTEPVPDQIWTGTLEVQDIPLTNTLTIYSDKSFTLDTIVTLLGVGLDFNDVGAGTVTGEPAEEGEITFVLEELASDIVPLLESVGAAAIPLPLTITATIKDETLTLPDVGLGQEIVLVQQPAEE